MVLAENVQMRPQLQGWTLDTRSAWNERLRPDQELFQFGLVLAHVLQMVSDWTDCLPHQRIKSSPLERHMYQRRIAREHPTSFIFVVDQSNSMAEPFGASTGTKAVYVARALNRLIQNLIDMATKEEIRHYYDFAVIGYGAKVELILHGSQPGNEFVPVDLVADNPLSVIESPRKVADGAGGLVEVMEKMPIWIQPTANGHTPMCEAFQQALVLAEKASCRYPKSYPPTVIHITDGEFTTNDPTPLMERITRFSTSDGNVLLFNIHISKESGSHFLPKTDANLPNDYARMLYHTASVLPPIAREMARAEGYDVNDQTRGFAFNADAVELIQFLNIGTGTTGTGTTPRGPLLPAGSPDH